MNICSFSAAHSSLFIHFSLFHIINYYLFILINHEIISLWISFQGLRRFPIARRSRPVFPGRLPEMGEHKGIWWPALTGALLLVRSSRMVI
jgi:hypothetical protein